jgi:putative phage-type endonuclease
MISYIFDLEPLEDITDKLIFEDEPTIFTEENTIELVETVFYLIDEYISDNPNSISDPDFQENLLEEIKEIFYIQMEEDILNSDYIEDDMNDILEDAFNIYINTFCPERSISNNIEFIDNNQHKNLIEKKIQYLREIPQPQQRTPEWYKFRWNLITASNAWKAFENQTIVNQLIYEKCNPLKDFNDIDDTNSKMVNLNTPLHWGKKYEPVSVMIYENMYNSIVEDFGCIQHPNYYFIGASPDGIVIESNTGRYGRMLEIKNVVNREINGIPKKEYWIQMQLQMEVCDLDECDFLETKFIEYNDYESYKNDTLIESFNKTLKGEYKGIIIYFNTKEGEPYYIYMPLNYSTNEEVISWQDNMINTYENEPYNYTFMKFIYWKLEKLSCVLVLRNKDWFKNNIGQLEKVWDIIKEERVTGFEHRAPIKKKKEIPIKSYVKSINEDVCFLKVIKID